LVAHGLFGAVTRQLAEGRVDPLYLTLTVGDDDGIGGRLKCTLLNLKLLTRHD